VIQQKYVWIKIILHYLNEHQYRLFLRWRSNDCYHFAAVVDHENFLTKIRKWVMGRMKGKKYTFRRAFARLSRFSLSTIFLVVQFTRKKWLFTKVTWKKSIKNVFSRLLLNDRWNCPTLLRNCENWRVEKSVSIEVSMDTLGIYWTRPIILQDYICILAAKSAIFFFTVLMHLIFKNKFWLYNLLFH
jgi:hypothetical protein